MSYINELNEMNVSLQQLLWQFFCVTVLLHQGEHDEACAQLHQQHFGSPNDAFQSVWKEVLQEIQVLTKL